MKLADAHGALAWSRVRVRVPTLVFIARSTLPEVGTFAGGVPTSLRFGFPVVSALKSQVPSLPSTVGVAEPLAAALELSLLLPRPEMSQAAPPTTSTATTTKMISRLRRRLRACSARFSIWRWRRRWAAWRRCLLVGTGRLLGQLSSVVRGAADGWTHPGVRHPAARRRILGVVPGGSLAHRPWRGGVITPA